MILQFPTPYPGELLYSTIGRYHLRAGNVYWKHTLEDLYGKRTISATAFLPSGIYSLVKSLPINTTIDEQTLIFGHTLYPFYSSFLQKEKANSIYEAMLSDDGKRIYMQSGMMASSIKQNKYFKYCPVCLKDSNYGEMYWQRQHQLPGRLICLKHRVWLEESSVSIIQSNKHIFTLPNEENCCLVEGRPVDKGLMDFYLDFHKQAEILLNKRFGHKTFSHFTEFYRKHLIEKGYANFNGQVNQRKLYDAFISFYSHQFLENLNIDVGSLRLWLESITRKHRKSFHPYYHILMLIFLGLEVADIFMDGSTSVEPFGKQKYPCLNIVCPKYRRDVISNISIRTCEKTKLPIRRLTCSTCGFSYTKKGSEQNQEERYKYTRIMDFGSLWKHELKRLLEQNLSYRAIARQLQVDTNTVIKYEKILNGERLQVKKTSDKKLLEDKIKSHRLIWSELVQKNPKLSKTELRRIHPSTYTFLYRNDRDWLNENSPKLRKPKSENKRVNWQERDQEILIKVQKATKELKNLSGEMKRITVKSIGDAIGERALMEKHLNRMPKTKEFIRRIYESEQEYRLRRIRRTIKEMNDAGECIKKWKVYRKAGIKSDFIGELEGINPIQGRHD